MSRNLVLAGNYNMTNVDDLFQQLVELGQHPKEKSDNVTMLEKIGHFLDEENERIYHKYRQLGYSKFEISGLIKAEMDLEQVLKNAFRKVDGGYNMVGLVGDGNAFVIRDPAGIRPSYYYEDEEVFVVTSERPAIQTAFNVDPEAIYELEPGCAVIVNREGVTRISRILEPEEKRSCSFERIYFSRGNDTDIYRERKNLGRHLSGEVLRKIDFDVRNTVFSYIPNTAATSFYGMIDGIHRYLERYKREEIIKLGANPNPVKVDEIIGIQARREKILIKDVKMRTFITQDKDREDLVGHVYDVTYGIVQPGIDTLVVIDDSIVRGTTLKQSILKILDRLQPAKIVVASSAPIIKYPDCYGIDMSRMHEFVAFQALLELLKRNGLEHKLQETYEFCLEQLQLPAEQMENGVQRLYNLFSDEELTAVISELLTPVNLKAEVKIIFQTVENLHKACPGHTGDWYFTGNYPTPGGTKVVNRSFVYYMQGNNSRAY
jgi:amidophosphoribosyltransferase